jgi:photosystem II stability/assembly factor-like uncharacterized protein
MSPSLRFACCLSCAIVFTLLLAGGPARAGIDQWTNTGPFGGNVQTLVVDPQNPATLYAAAPGGGVFKSVDGGANWVSASNGISDRNVAALAIDPVTPTTLYASSSDHGVSGTGPSGVFKSTDGAQSWTKLPVDPNSFFPGLALALAIDPQTTSTIYAASGGFGIIKSIDGGQTWSAGSGLPNGPSYVSVAIDPHTPTTIYAGSTDGSASGAGLFKSVDGGASWTAINNGITGSSTLDVLGLAVDPQTPTTLYASMETVSNSSGLYKSINGGASWTLVESNVGGPIAINPQTPSTLYIGGGGSGFGLGSGVLVSSNGGASFAPVDNGLGAVNVNIITINPQSPAALYAGTASGMFVTMDGGASWSAADNGLSLLTVSTITIDQANPATIYAGTSGNGLFKSVDGGGSWAAIDTGLLEFGTLPDISTLSIDPTNSSTLYAGVNETVFKSLDGGAHWAAANNGITTLASVVSIAIDPQSPANVYAGLSFGIYKSTDGGASWALADTGLPAIPNGNQGISGLSILGPPVPVLLLSTRGNGVFFSNDGANNWQNFDTSMPSANSTRSQFITPAQQACADDEFDSHVFGILNVNFLPVTPTDAEVFVSCVSPDATATGSNKVTLKNGYTFTIPLNFFDNSSKTLPVYAGRVASGVQVASGVTVTSWSMPDGASESACEPLGPMIAHPLDSTTFYTGGGCGVLQGTNSGAQMASMSLGLPTNLQVSALAITPNASDLYAGAQGGVYRFSFAPSVLAAAVLPSSRSVELGVTATAFATIANGGSAAATSCGLSPSTSLPADFFYQTTAPATNALTGSPNTPADIPAGAFQTFVFGFTPSAGFDPIDAQLEFSCSGQPPVAVLPGINTLLLSGSATPVPDVVALVATGSNDGILHIMGTAGANAFALATINIGAAAAITATAIISDPSLPLAVSICQTNPSTGQCLAPPTPGVSQTINTDDTPTFAIFATSSGVVPFVPANNRIAVQFTDTNGTVRGSTSVAVETQ